MNPDTNNVAQIIRRLMNSGFNVHGVDNTYVFLEDPSCVVRSFETFMNYAWTIAMTVTAILLFGWAIALIRGTKIQSIVSGFPVLVIMIGSLAVAKPMLNMIYGKDIFARGCRTIQVKLSDIQQVLDSQNLRMSDGEKYVINSRYSMDAIINAGLTDVDTSVSSDSVTTVVPYYDNNQDDKGTVATMQTQNSKPLSAGVDTPDNATKTSGTIAGQHVIAPLQNIHVTSGYGPRVHPVTGEKQKPHHGVDLRCPVGTETMAIASGRVTKASDGWNGGYGTMVEIDHGAGFTTRYAHMSKLNVAVGDHVSQGSIIGLCGSTGRSTGPHLHYEVRYNGQPFNPQEFIEN